MSQPERAPWKTPERTSGMNGIARPSVTALGVTFALLSLSLNRSSISSRGPKFAHETGPSSWSAWTSLVQTRLTVSTRSSSLLRMRVASEMMSSSKRWLDHSSSSRSLMRRRRQRAVLGDWLSPNATTRAKARTGKAANRFEAVGKRLKRPQRQAKGSAISLVRSRGGSVAWEIIERDSKGRT